MIKFLQPGKARKILVVSFVLLSFLYLWLFFAAKIKIDGIVINDSKGDFLTNGARYYPDTEVLYLNFALLLVLIVGIFLFFSVCKKSSSPDYSCNCCSCNHGDVIVFEFLGYDG